ncbi:flagellar motor protein MotB [Herbivorax sp. ANBcel31]|uniref:flagellar motor protein MotB n=1 Tax=Herbivorax sp. ANBcel31 TaxID=3069754 RepID=UPI0027B324EA|nr:flagellar motor protein MotB [Herbivorax sp. ANBcel31]MDQ2086556.1 flagellar motor protein MotB [Herbivorax sp. ANBcel31]
MSKRRDEIEEEKSEGTPEWMVTYSDMMTLLLCFFVLLFSMAVIDQERFEEVAQSLRTAFLSSSDGEMFEHNKGTEVVDLTESVQASDLITSNLGNIYDSEEEEQEESTEEMTEEEKSEKLEEFVKELREYIFEMNLDEYVQVLDEENQVILRIDSVILFDLGKADIKESGKGTLREVGYLLNSVDSEVVVQGHTDNLPINTTIFPSNWELSTRRATNVVVFLIDESDMNPVRLTATGNGEFRPIAPNDTPENRQKNRRIDIVVDK